MRASSHLAIVLALVGVAAVAPLSFGQTGDDSSVTYALRDFSNHQEGCFAPCMCPILARFLGGTFDLTPTGPDGEFETFDVDNIDWTVALGGSEIERVTGTGRFQVGAEQQRLVVDLQFDGGPVERYDSGVVPAPVEFPEVDVLASIGELYCYDEAVALRARPVEPGFIYLSLLRSSLSWSVAPGADAYDIVAGDLDHLRQSGGSFAWSANDCLADDLNLSVLDHTAPPGERQGFWFLVRGHPVAPYDSNGSSQAARRDPALEESPVSCP